MLLQRFSLEAMRHYLELDNVLSWSTIALLENAPHFSIKDCKRTPKETVRKFIKLWGVFNDGSSNCNAILRYLSSRLFCSLITIDSHLKNALTSGPSCFHSSAKFNQMKDCVVKVVKYCDDSLTDSTIRKIADKDFKSKECSEGRALIPPSSAASLPCSSSFVTEANACTRTFRQIFVADKSSSSLCTWVCVDYLFLYNKLNHTRILIGCYLWCKRIDDVNVINYASLWYKTN